MIEAARRARRPDRQSRDARFAQAMRALPACNLRRSEVVPSRRELPAGEDARLSKEQRASRAASRAGRCSYSSKATAAASPGADFASPGRSGSVVIAGARLSPPFQGSSALDSACMRVPRHWSSLPGRPQKEALMTVPFAAD